MTEAETVPPAPRFSIKKLLPVIVLAAGFIAVYASGLHQYLSFEALREHRETVVAMTQDWGVIGFFGYVLLYMLLVAFSLPGGLFMTILGGFLYGPFIGALGAVSGAVTGAIIIFLAAKNAFRDYFQARAGAAIRRMEAGFHKNELSYMFVLRLVPLFPFFLVNLAPAFFGVSLRNYMIATVFGIIPGTFVYALLGNGLGAIFDRNETPNLSLVFDPEILIPILGLALLALIPVFYKRVIAKQP